MRKNSNSSRSLKFIARNSLKFDRTREYVSNLCDDVFELKGYWYESYKNGETAFWIIIGLNKYIIYLDCDHVELKIIKNDKLEKTFTGDTCWYQGLKYIAKEVVSY